MATYERLDYGSPDGSRWCTSTDLLAMYGAVPATQYTAVGAASTYLTYQQSTASASTWGFANELALTSMILQVSTLTQAAKRFGLVA